MKTNNERKYHYFYKITNNINNHFYYGIHSTDNLDDGYMGSGSRLNYAYKTYGIENFTKEILKFFGSRKECSDYEAKVVNEVLIEDPNCYNSILGGDNGTTYGTATVKDKNGNIFQVLCNDKHILSGDFVGITSGFVTCYDNILNKYVYISVNEYHENKNRYSSILKNKIIVKNLQNNKIEIISKDLFYKSNNFVGVTKNKHLCKDKFGHYYLADVNDSRIADGTLSSFWKGRKHSISTIEKMKQTHKANKHQQGEKNSQYGTCWIMKDGISKKIKKYELETYISEGWEKGRKCIKKYK